MALGAAKKGQTAPIKTKPAKVVKLRPAVPPKGPKSGGSRILAFLKGSKP